ncbi:MAG: hypothetical protein N2Z23_07385 [Pyrinomonadaceae bacterium]|nr:hypothetical protein [Pyrinomonadaceae bacterium]MCX7640246.1 hypothetical protein [Pyrinomonadaceae bacterium]MDW8305130.1 hypothetical protein [Acidobacteriota bacterium]
MKGLRFLLTIVLFSSFVIAQSEQSSDKQDKQAKLELPTVKQILDKYIEATGGRKAREAVNTMVIKGKVEILPVGLKGDFESYSAFPNKLFTAMNIAGLGKMLEVFDGQRGWSVDPMRGKVEKKGMELQQISIQAMLHKDINLDKLYQDMQVTGVEKVGDSEAYVVVGRTSKEADLSRFYFDKRTGFLVRQDEVVFTQEGKFPSVIFYEDMRDVNGIKVPYKTTTSLADTMRIVITVSSVELNVEIDDKIFAEPK